MKKNILDVGWTTVEKEEYPVRVKIILTPVFRKSLMVDKRNEALKEALLILKKKNFWICPDINYRAFRDNDVCQEKEIVVLRPVNGSSMSSISISMIFASMGAMNYDPGNFWDLVSLAASSDLCLQFPIVALDSFEKKGDFFVPYLDGQENLQTGQVRKIINLYHPIDDTIDSDFGFIGARVL